MSAGALPLEFIFGSRRSSLIGCFSALCLHVSPFGASFQGFVLSSLLGFVRVDAGSAAALKSASPGGGGGIASWRRTIRVPEGQSPRPRAASSASRMKKSARARISSYRLRALLFPDIPATVLFKIAELNKSAGQLVTGIVSVNS
jgi:hypothetical protein